MKFLIFGATGYIGSHLSGYLSNAGHEVYKVSRSQAKGVTGMDITDQTQFRKIEFAADVVVNCVSKLPESSKDSENPVFLKELFLTNVVGAVNIANWSASNGVPLLINCSSLSVVKRPWPVPLSEEDLDLPDGIHTGYGMSKLSQEQLMNQCLGETATNLVHLRISGAYGGKMPTGGIIVNLFEKLSKGQKLSLTDAEKNTFDIIHVDDICRSIEKVAMINPESQTLNLASGKPVSLWELAQELKKLLGSTSEIENTSSNHAGSQAVVDNQRLRNLLDEVYNEFIPLEEGLKTISTDKLKAPPIIENKIG